MAVDFTNQSFFNANNGETVSIYPSNIYLVTMVDVNVEKTATPALWGSGPLTYEITITNDETIPLTDVTFSDTLNTQYTTLINGTVYVDDEEIDDYNYDPDTGVLTFAVKNIPSGGSVTVTFQVSKK